MEKVFSIILMSVMFVSCKEKEQQVPEESVETVISSYHQPNPQDVDLDGIEDQHDDCPLIPNTPQEDSDNDGVGNACDNCQDDSNSYQEDGDHDNIGDACDDDGNNNNNNNNDNDNDNENNNNNNDNENNNDTPDPVACFNLGASSVGHENDVEVVGSIVSMGLNDYALTGFGARAKDDNAKGIVLIATPISSEDGSLNYSRSKKLKFGDLGKPFGESFVKLPPGFMATGFGVATTRDGGDISFVKLYGARFNTDGEEIETIECSAHGVSHHANCSMHTRVSKKYKKTYKEYRAPQGQVLTGLGIKITKKKVSKLWAEIAPISLSCDMVDAVSADHSDEDSSDDSFEDESDDE